MFADIFRDLLHAWERSRDSFWGETWVFLSLTLRALGLALILGIPAGMIFTRLARLAHPVMAAFAVLQTIPSIVLLGLLIPLIGVGQMPALVAAVLYSLFPIMVNTYVGITQVAPSIRDAARGMGMTDRQVLLHVELPLAFPVILAGVRTGAVYVSGMIAIGALVGAGGLGTFIQNGMSRDDSGLIWLGALPILVLTLTLFWGLGGIAWLARRNNGLGLLVGGGLILVLSAYAVFGLAERVLRPQRTHIVIGAKDFTEGQILAEVLKQVIENQTDLRAEVVQNLGTSVILKALNAGEIDLYPEYTGNLLTSKEALDMPAPDDRSKITAVVRTEMKRRFGLVLLDTFGLNNTYAPCVTQETARRHSLTKISDLRRVPQFRIVIDLSFLTRPDGWKGLIEKYDLHFDRPPIQVSPNLLYKALEQKEADLVIGFATDWQIAEQSLVVLDDDRGYFPNYHAAPLVRGDVLRQHPDLAPALNRLAGRIDDKAMRRLNYQVAVERRSEVEVARAFLREQGLLRAR